MITRTRLPSSGNASYAWAIRLCTALSASMSVVEPEPRTIPLSSSLDAAKGRKAAIDGNDLAGDKSRRPTHQPQQRAHQIICRAQPPHWRMRQDGLHTRRWRAAVDIHHQVTILLRQKEAGRKRVHANTRAIFLGHVDRQPLCKVHHCRFGRTIRRDARQRAQSAHRSDVHYAALPALGHCAPKHLTRLEGSSKVCPQDLCHDLALHFKEKVFSGCCRLWMITPGGIHQNIQRAKGRHDPLSRMLQGSAVKHIAGNAKRLASGGANTLSKALAWFGAAAHNRHLCPGLRQRSRHCAAQRAAAASDKRRLVLKGEKLVER